MTQSELQPKIVSKIVENFLRTRKGTGRRELIREFRDPAVPNILEQLERDAVIKREGNGQYTPSIAAFYLAKNDEALRDARHGFLLVARVLRDFYFDDVPHTNMRFEELIARVRSLEPEAAEDLVQLGLYLIGEMGLSGGYGTEVREGVARIANVNTSERLAMIQNLEQEWEDEIRRRLPKENKANQQVLIDGFDDSDPKAGIGTKWEKIRLLGSGGQSKVWLVRSVERQAEITKSAEEILNFQSRRAFQFVDQHAQAKSFASAVKTLVRDELSSDLGAFKEFDIPEEGVEAELALERLRRETHVLSKPRPGLLKLLDANEAERWIVTEYFPQGSLERQMSAFKGRPLVSLKAFRTLVQTVASLHKDGIVHRDIKPPNIFVRSNEELVLGDFGIVYLPDQGERVTMTNEKVGPRDYMPPWAPITERQGTVKPDFDVYMLGKLLWCMVSGRVKLFREYHKKADLNLERMFPGDQNMSLINKILDRCITEDQDKCLPDAGQLLDVVDETLALMERGLQPLEAERRCRVCGKGIYRAQGGTQGLVLQIPMYDNRNSHIGQMRLVPFLCDYCTHFEFFAPGYPEDAKKRN